MLSLVWLPGSDGHSLAGFPEEEVLEFWNCLFVLVCVWSGLFHSLSFPWTCDVVLVGTALLTISLWSTEVAAVYHIQRGVASGQIS